MKKKILLSTALMLSSLFIIRCGGGSDDGGSINSLEFANQDDAMIAYNNSDVSCGELNDDCPSFSGALFAYEKIEKTNSWGGVDMYHSIGLCSQQLISPTKILTNEHCIPKGLRYAGASCKGKIYLKFPHTKDFPAEDVHCKNIESIVKGTENVIESDWAIITLENPIKRTPVNINTNGIPDQSTLTAYPVYFTSSSHSPSGVKTGHGSMKKANCTSLMAHYMSELYFDEKAPLVGGTCDKSIIPGNSGSGLFNTKNEIVGLISFANDTSKDPVTIGDGPKTKLNDLMFGGTNIHCIDELNSQRHPFCQIDVKKYPVSFPVGHALSLNTLLKQKTLEEYQDIEEANINNTDYVRWTNTPHEDLEDMILRNDSVQFISTQLPDEYMSLFLEQSAGTFLTQSPECVDFDAPSEFETDLKKLSLHQISSEENGTYIAETEHVTQLLQFKRIDNSDEPYYEASFKRLEGNEKAEFLKLSEDLEKKQQDCSSATLLKSFYCGRAQRAEADLDIWLATSSVDPRIIENETLLDGHSFNYTFKIPTCE